MTYASPIKVTIRLIVWDNAGDAGTPTRSAT